MTKHTHTHTHTHLTGSIVNLEKNSTNGKFRESHKISVIKKKKYKERMKLRML